MERQREENCWIVVTITLCSQTHIKKFKSMLTYPPMDQKLRICWDSFNILFKKFTQLF